MAAMLLVSATVAAGCGGDSGGGSSDGKGPIKIGVMLPLTGPAAFFGPLQRDGIKLRLEEAANKAAGRDVKLIIIDSGADLATAMPRARKLVEQDGVSMIIGPLQSDLLAGLLPYYTQKKIPVVSLLNHPRAFKQAPYLFTPQGELKLGAKPLGKYAAEELGVKTATIEAADYIAGKDVAGGFKEGFTEAGGDIVQEQYAPLDTNDFGPFTADLEDADAMVAWNVGTTQNFLSEYLKRGPLEHTLIGYGDAITEDQLQDLGKGSLGWLTPLSYTWRLDTPASKKFADAIRAKYNRDPVAQIDEGAYEAMSVVLEGIEATDGDTDPDKLQKTIRGLTLDTPAGPVKFDKDGFGIRNVYILEATQFGKKIGWKPVHTYENVGLGF
jgi:branched-chain amino acid transport system substrate-binding protein